MTDTAAIADRAVSILSDMRLTAELYMEETVSSSITVSSGKVQSVEMSEERGAGIRVFERGRIGFAHTSDLSPEGLRRAAGLARRLADHADADACHRLPEGGGPAGREEPDGDLSVAGAETYRKVALARAMEEAARGVDPRITRVPLARYEDLVGSVEVRTTSGFSRGGRFARVYGSVEAVAEENGACQSGHGSDFDLRFAALDPFRIGREAARRAVDKLGAVRARSCRADVVFDPLTMAEILEALSPAFHGEQVLKGKSFLAGKIGRQIASGSVTLVDDGRLPGADGTFAFDGEGISTARTVLVEGGVLRQLLHNSWSAGKMGQDSTGNASRTSYMCVPGTGATTLYLEPSKTSPEEILGEVGEGFRISELMGLHTLDPITGEFSLGATGRIIRDGRLEGPVAGIGLAGTVAGLLAGIARVGSDLRLLPGEAAGSTTLVRGLALSGD